MGCGMPRLCRAWTSLQRWRGLSTRHRMRWHMTKTPHSRTDRVAGSPRLALLMAQRMMKERLRLPCRTAACLRRLQLPTMPRAVSLTSLHVAGQRTASLLSSIAVCQQHSML